MEKQRLWKNINKPEEAYEDFDRFTDEELDRLTKVFAFETSCDDSCVSLYDVSNNSALNNIIYSQDHTRFGGILPEYASRNHMDNISKLAEQALIDANLSMKDIDVIAATYAPGLVGSLMIGFNFAKGLAWAGKKKFVGVHHIEAHILAAKYSCNIDFPYGALVVSGGHTLLCIAHGLGDYEILGTSMDDAVGECFDKVAREIGLGQPGGPLIEKLATHGSASIKLPIPLHRDGSCNFSLSGLKTAAIRAFNGSNANNIAASLQEAICDHLIERLGNALSKHPNINTWAIVGGVAANKYIFEKINYAFSNKNIVVPEKRLCTDNALMIAYTAGLYAKQGHFSKFNLGVYGKLPLSRQNA